MLQYVVIIVSLLAFGIWHWKPIQDKKPIAYLTWKFVNVWSFTGQLQLFNTNTLKVFKL